MTADGQPACTPAPLIGTPPEQILDDAIGLALVSLLGRRRFLQAAAGGLATLLLAACSASPAATPPAPSPSGTPPAKPAEGKAPWVFVFNVGSRDVTIIDSATNQVVATRPLGAAVRWLSNEQRYWDGRFIWSYDFPDNKLQAIAIDPKEVKVARTIDTGTKGPGHSLMLTPDRKTALLNAAGSNVINVIDLAAGQVTDQIETGKFP